MSLSASGFLGLTGQLLLEDGVEGTRYKREGLAIRERRRHAAILCSRMEEESQEARHDAIFGSNLRKARDRWKLSLREVEERSELLAKEWGHPDYSISAAWLVRVENGRRGLTAARLIALAAIYGLAPEEMLQLYQRPPASEAALAKLMQPNATVLLRSGPVEGHARQLLPDVLYTDDPPQSTRLLQPPADLSSPLRRAIIGKLDRTMEPMIRAGSYVLIDTHKRSIAKKRGGLNEFERPIYFLMTREAYLTGFCELDKSEELLTLVPHPLSPMSHRRFKFREDVEVIGTVVGLALRLD